MKKQISILLLLLFCSFNSYSQDTLKEIKVQSTRKSLQKSLKLTANTTIVSSKELLKAACCNLAESFETNPSIDVNFSDAFLIWGFLKAENRWYRGFRKTCSTHRCTPGG